MNHKPKLWYNQHCSLLREERAHIEEYLQNAAAKKKELDKERNATFCKYNKKELTPSVGTPLF